MLTKATKSTGLFFGLLCCAWILNVQAKPPAIRWAQDKDSIYITISVECSSNKKFSTSNLVFDLSCKKRNGEDFNLKFDLREAIRPAESSCKSVRGEEECKLVKLHPHFFDRLTRDTDSLKQLKPDWSRWKEEEEPSIPQDETYEGSKDLKKLNSKDIDSALNQGALVIVDVFFPWCTHCSYNRKYFLSSAKELGSDKHIFGWVDAREDFESADRYNTSCDYKCKFLVLEKDQKPFQVQAKSNEKEMASLFKSYLVPSVTSISSEAELVKFKEAHPVFALALFKDKKHEDFQTLNKAAPMLRGRVPIAFSDRSMGSFHPPSIQVFANSSEGRPVTLGGNETEMGRRVLIESMPLVEEYSWPKREVFEGLGLPLVQAFIDDKATDAPGQMRIVSTLAAEFRGKLAFLQYKKADEYMLKDFGLPEKLPAFGIAQNFSYNSVRYAHDGAFEEAELRTFLQKFVDGKAAPAYKSEPAPKDAPVAGKVAKAVWKTLVGLASGGKPVLLMVYKPWNQQREKATAALEKLASALQDVEGVVVASLDASKNHVDPALLAYRDDEDSPALFALAGDGSAGDRLEAGLSLKEMLKWAARKVPQVKASWEGSVKTRLKKMKEEEEERKRRKEEEDKVEAEKRAEELKKLEELLATAEKQDVGERKDGGIVKQVVSAGSGPKPNKGDSVKAHYTGTLLDGSKFDSSRDRGEPFSFTLGKGQVIPCWDQAFATMTKGERAVITCEAKYAYGERGSPPKIPPDSTLRFDVELVSFGKEEL